MILLSLTQACNDDDFLTREPTKLLTEDQLWSSNELVLSLIADLYDRNNYYGGFYIDEIFSMADFDEAFITELGEISRKQIPNYPFSYWSYWDYAYVREINLFIQKAEKADKLEESERIRFVAEGRFLRASTYFELVKNKRKKTPFSFKDRVGAKVYREGLKKNIILRPLGNVVYLFLPLSINKFDIKIILRRAKNVIISLRLK